MNKEISPNEVYERVEYLVAIVLWLARLIGLLCLLVLVQIAAKSIIFKRIMHLLNRVESLLVLAERHGQLSDATASDIKGTTLQAARQVTATVKTVGEQVKAEVPAAVVQEMKKDTATGGESGELRMR